MTGNRGTNCWTKKNRNNGSESRWDECFYGSLSIISVSNKCPCRLHILTSVKPLLNSVCDWINHEWLRSSPGLQSVRIDQQHLWHPVEISVHSAEFTLPVSVRGLQTFPMCACGHASGFRGNAEQTQSHKPGLAANANLKFCSSNSSRITQVFQWGCPAKCESACWWNSQPVQTRVFWANPLYNIKTIGVLLVQVNAVF